MPLLEQAFRLFGLVLPESRTGDRRVVDPG